MFIGYKLLPSKVSSITITTKEVEAITDFYGIDMPGRDHFEAEVEVWKAHCLQIPQSETNEIALQDALKIADSDFFPNVHSIPKLVLTWISPL